MVCGAASLVQLTLLAKMSDVLDNGQVSLRPQVNLRIGIDRVDLKGFLPASIRCAHHHTGGPEENVLDDLVIDATADIDPGVLLIFQVEFDQVKPHLLGFHGFAGYEICGF